MDKTNNPTLTEGLEGEAAWRLEVMTDLLQPCDRSTYGQRLREGAAKLGISVRSLQRLFKRYQEEGLSALMSGPRRDRGAHRIGEEWVEFIVKTYQEGNKGSKRLTPKQVAIRVRAQAHQKGQESYPSYRTVLRVLEPYIENKNKSIRSPGWRGEALSLKTRDGDALEAIRSNQVWQCDHTRADVLLVDGEGRLIGRPWLTTVIDSYSRCIVGIDLSFDAPSSQKVALALRHAILPKQYGAEYKLNCEWNAYGKPECLFTDGGKDFRSNHLAEIAAQLGFILKLRDRPSEGGIVERPFKTLNQSLFSTLPGYTGPNVKERPEDAEKEATLTLRELEILIVRYIVDNYNQKQDARTGDQTRSQRWEGGIDLPEPLSERELDTCLMKSTRRKIQRGGHLQFENITYRGEHLGGYEGDYINLRYDPRDITSIWVYRQEGSGDVFLCRAHAVGLQTEILSLNDAQAAAKRLREKGRGLDNNSILQESIEREAAVTKSLQKRKKEEQAYKTPTPAPQEKVELTPEVSKIEDMGDLEVWDLDELNGWG